MSTLLLCFVTFAVLTACELGYFALAKKLHIVDRPNERSSHHKPVLLGGGILFFLALLFYSATHTLALPQFLIGAAILAVVSYADDLHPLPSWLRLIAQLAALLITFYGTINALDTWKILLVIIFFAGILNVYNFMDGINGMLALYSIVVVGTFGYVQLFVRPFTDPMLIFTVLTALVIFGFFNCRDKARCFSGDVGSIVMGLIVIYLLTTDVMANPTAAPWESYLTFIIVFLADGLLTIAKRFLNGRNILEPHREHLYETLVNDLKVPHLRVSVAYAFLQLLINMGYFFVSDKTLYVFLWALVLTIGYGLFFFFVNRKKNSIDNNTKC